MKISPVLTVQLMLPFSKSRLKNKIHCCMPLVCCWFLANVNSRSLYAVARPSVICL